MGAGLLLQPGEGRVVEMEGVQHVHGVPGVQHLPGVPGVPGVSGVSGVPHNGKKGVL